MLCSPGAAGAGKREGQITIGLTQVWKFITIKAPRAKPPTHPSPKCQEMVSPDCSTAGSDGWPGVTRCFFGIPSDLGGNFMAIKADGAKPELSEMPSSSRCASLPKKCSQCMPCLDLGKFLELISRWTKWSLLYVRSTIKITSRNSSKVIQCGKATKIFREFAYSALWNHETAFQYT